MLPITIGTPPRRAGIRTLGRAGSSPGWSAGCNRLFSRRGLGIVMLLGVMSLQHMLFDGIWRFMGSQPSVVGDASTLPFPRLLAHTQSRQDVLLQSVPDGELASEENRALFSWEGPLHPIPCWEVKPFMLPLWVRTKRVFVASNFYNSAPVLPNFLHQVLLLAKALGPENVEVSIYESNSRDMTKQLLQEIEHQLTRRGIKNTIITTMAFRQRKDNRIDYLSKLRNYALEPFYKSTTAFDNIVFVNDVLFCAHEVLRLLAYDADMACGIDTVHCGFFYDKWVSRDATGDFFLDWPPYINKTRAMGTPLTVIHNTSTYEHAVPVFCCWNGLAVLRAEPFHKGLRFRSTFEPEQPVLSECTHVCKDLWRNGYRKVLVDTQVITYYTAEDMACHRKRPPAFPDPYHVMSNISAAPLPTTVLEQTLAPGRGNMNYGVEWGKTHWPWTPATKDTMDLKKLCASSHRFSRSIPLNMINLAWDDMGRGSYVGREVWILHPDYNFINMTQTEAQKFIYERYPRLTPTLKSLNGTQNQGLARDLVVLALMFKYGGIYMDNAMRPVKSLDCVIALNETFMRFAYKGTRPPSAGMLDSFAAPANNLRVADTLERIVEFVRMESKGGNETVNGEVTVSHREEFHKMLFEEHAALDRSDPREEALRI